MNSKKPASTSEVEIKKKKLRPHQDKSLYATENRKGLTEESKLRDMFKAVIDESGEGIGLFPEEMDMPRFGVLNMDLFGYGLVSTVHFGTIDVKKDEKDQLRKANAAIAFIGEIEPKDSVEFFLASQMFAVHDLAMTMATRAAIPDQQTDGIDRNINRITKLMRTFTTQMDALNKHRTKGQQKITVQHVNVENGGQAIVGDVSQGGASE
jgi:hypothetical protein